MLFPHLTKLLKLLEYFNFRMGSAMSLEFSSSFLLGIQILFLFFTVAMTFCDMALYGIYRRLLLRT
jgi:hypothetical protein